MMQNVHLNLGSLVFWQVYRNYAAELEGKRQPEAIPVAREEEAPQWNWQSRFRLQGGGLSSSYQQSTVGAK